LSEDWGEKEYVTAPIFKSNILLLLLKGFWMPLVQAKKAAITYRIGELMGFWKPQKILKKLGRKCQPLLLLETL
jgi:hypothetical protein